MIENLPARPPQIRSLSDSLTECVLRWRREHRDAEEGKKRARDAKGLEVLMAYLGKTRGNMTRTGLWETISPVDDEIWATVPLFAGMIRSVMKEATKSKPQYGYRGDFADVDSQELARFGSTLIEYFTKSFFGPMDDQADVLTSIGFGCGATEVLWNPRAGEPQELVGVSCPACKTEGHIHAGEADGDVECPECAGLMDKGEERQEFPPGDVELCRIDPFSLNSNTWATKQRPAVWWAIDEIVDRAVWETLHPECDLRENSIGITYGENLLHLRRQRSYVRAQMGLESSAAASRERTEKSSERDVLRLRDFFAPEQYQRYKTGAGETLPSGRVIDSNTALAEMFPEGLCVLCDDMEHVVDIYPADPRRSIHIWNFSTKPGDCWGSSTAAQALECQYNLEEDLSELQAVASEMGTPTRWYDSSLFDGRLGTHPGGQQPVNFKQLNDRGLKDLVYDAPAQNPSPVIFQLVLFYEQRMQGILSAWSSMSGGLPDAVGNTATGMLKAGAEYEAQQGMYLELRAEHKLEVLQEALRLFSENADIRRALSMGGPFADGAVLMLDRHMLPSKFSLELKKDSWWPRDRGQQQQAEVQRYQILQLANAVSMQIHGHPLDTVEERYINDLCGSEIGANLAQIGAEIAATEWKKAKAFITSASQSAFVLVPEPTGIGLVFQQQPAPEVQQALEGALEQLKQQAQMAAMQQQMMATIQTLGQQPEEPGGEPGGEPGAVPGEAPGNPAPPMQPQIPPPTPEEIILTAADLAVPIRPGLTPSFRAVAGQLRYEALKTVNRELPDIYLNWLDRRATMYDSLGQNQKMIETGAAGPAMPEPAGAGQPGTGASGGIEGALLTKLEAIQGGSADALGLPGAGSSAGGASAPQIGSGYGPS